MTAYEIDEEIERALDRWIEALPEPRPSRQDAVIVALRDFLVGQGVLLWGEAEEEGDSTLD